MSPDADLIVTTCPLCIINLSDGGGNVIDLAQLIERSKKCELFGIIRGKDVKDM
ncbi:MAG: hypothetical protein SBU_000437 [Candidatus Syntrophoarchaeum butanivorans]|uniref:Cysteine-rich domain-containing protein n=1 Tax=Candidatus Syntropharchaeum butanivorans TaxID=1839936 RepID=A0A1F2P5C8_9EURY|nr:MAG: hypothetical protein SBU_000437 [Candidatus Syntrophoarchaeum butanivorans]